MRRPAHRRRPWCTATIVGAPRARRSHAEGRRSALTSARCAAGVRDWHRAGGGHPGGAGLRPVDARAVAGPAPAARAGRGRVALAMFALASPRPRGRRRARLDAGDLPALLPVRRHRQRAVPRRSAPCTCSAGAGGATVAAAAVAPVRRLRRRRVWRTAAHGPSRRDAAAAGLATCSAVPPRSLAAAGGRRGRAARRCDRRRACSARSRPRGDGRAAGRRQRADRRRHRSCSAPAACSTRVLDAMDAFAVTLVVGIAVLFAGFLVGQRPACGAAELDAGAALHAAPGAAACRRGRAGARRRTVTFVGHL